MQLANGLYCFDCVLRGKRDYIVLACLNSIVSEVSDLDTWLQSALEIFWDHETFLPDKLPPGGREILDFETIPKPS